MNIHLAVEPEGKAPESSKASVEIPDFDALAEKIATFTEREREILEAIANAEWGNSEGAAFKVKLAPSTFMSYASNFYKMLGLQSVPSAKKKKEYVREALRRLRLKEKEVARLARASTPAPEVAPPAPAIQGEVLAPQALAHAEPKEVEHRPAPVPSDVVGAPTGHGLVIPLPSNTVNVDVFSTQFSGRTAPFGIKEEIEKRRAQGLVPKFLVLIPIGDSKVAQAHIVSIEEK